MKRVSVLLLVMVLVGTASLVGDQENKFGYGKKKEPTEQTQEGLLFGLGFGLGVPSGVLGIIAELSPVEYLGITAGLGYAVEGLGYSFGLRVYPLGIRKKWSPYLSGYYGIVGVILDHATFTGGAIGGGLRMATFKSWSVAGELLYLLYEEKSYYDYGGRVKVALGFQWHIK